MNTMTLDHFVGLDMLVILSVFKVRLTTCLLKANSEKINYINASVKEPYCDSYFTLVPCGVQCVDFPTRCWISSNL